MRTALHLLPDLEAFVAPEASPYGWSLFAPPNSTMVPPWLFDLLKGRPVQPPPAWKA